MKILLVEDDQLISSELFAALVAHHDTVDVAADGQTGLELATALDYDLILLDWLIPKLDGMTLCRQLRSLGYQKPILLLTAKDSHTDIITGLDAGADDYIVKPYDVSELMARIRALQRRGNFPMTQVLTWGDLCLNPVSGEVRYSKQLICLTPKEYNLLELFLRNPRRIFSRSAIIDSLWSLNDSPSENAVTVHIKDLRQKLKASGMTQDIIETVYGLGYRLKTEPSRPTPTPDHATTGDARSHCVPKGRHGLASLDARSRCVPKGKNGLASLSTQAENSQPQSQGMASINRVLEQFRNSFTQQVSLLEQASSALSVGSLSDELRHKAQQEAHKLAGSLGTFGYPQGSKLARQIEYLLMGEVCLGQGEAWQFQQLISALRQELTKSPVVLTAEPIPAAHSIQVLIIDDDIALCELLRQQAVAWGMQVTIATDLTTARLDIAQTPPDVILLDLTFAHPAKDGLALLRELKEQFPMLPVLVFTGRDTLDIRVAVSRLGGRGFIHKPVDPEQVFQTIAQVLSLQQTAQARVMIVDDDPAALTTLCSLLQPWGLNVTSLENPKGFWDVLRATVPDLLVLDLEMPEFSGIDLCQVVRQDPDWGDLPILIVTAHTDVESIQRVFAAGADDFVGKPVVGPELVTRVMSRIERVRWRRPKRKC